MTIRNHGSGQFDHAPVWSAYWAASREWWVSRIAFYRAVL